MQNVSSTPSSPQALSPPESFEAVRQLLQERFRFVRSEAWPSAVHRGDTYVHPSSLPGRVLVITGLRERSLPYSDVEGWALARFRTN